jgi:hypothetical protein
MVAARATRLQSLEEAAAVGEVPPAAREALAAEMRAAIDSRQPPTPKPEGSPRSTRIAFFHPDGPTPSGRTKGTPK